VLPFGRRGGFHLRPVLLDIQKDAALRLYRGHGVGRKLSECEVQNLLALLKRIAALQDYSLRIAQLEQLSLRTLRRPGEETDQADFGKFLICRRDMTTGQDSTTSFNGYKDAAAKNLAASAFLLTTKPTAKFEICARIASDMSRVVIFTLPFPS
jgi:hypothetical protein